MISVINTSALSAVLLLVLLQLVWSILKPCSGWLFGNRQSCSSALAAATLQWAGQMVAHTGAAVICSGSPSVVKTTDCVLRDIQAALTGAFTMWVSASRREAVWEGILWLWERGGHKGCRPGQRCRVRCLQLLSAAAGARILSEVDSVLASLSFSGFCFLTLQGLSNIVMSLSQQPIPMRERKPQVHNVPGWKGWKPTGLGS